MTSATVKASRADKPARAGQAEGEPVADPLSAIRETGGRLAFDCGPGVRVAQRVRRILRLVFWSLVTDRYATRECLPARAIMSDQTRHQAWSLQLGSRGSALRRWRALGCSALVPLARPSGETGTRVMSQANCVALGGASGARELSGGRGRRALMGLPQVAVSVAVGPDFDSAGGGGTRTHHARRWRVPDRREGQVLMDTRALEPELLHRMDAYWRAANYLLVGQIYLYDNPLLRVPLELSHVTPLVVGGTGGTMPGQSLMTLDFNRVITKYDLEIRLGWRVRGMAARRWWAAPTWRAPTATSPRNDPGRGGDEGCSPSSRSPVGSPAMSRPPRRGRSTRAGNSGIP